MPALPVVLIKGTRHACCTTSRTPTINRPASTVRPVELPTQLRLLFSFCGHTYLFQPGTLRRYDSTRSIRQQPVLAAFSRTLFFSLVGQTTQLLPLLGRYPFYFSRVSARFRTMLRLFLYDLTGRKERTSSLPIPPRTHSGHSLSLSLFVSDSLIPKIRLTPSPCTIWFSTYAFPSSLMGYRYFMFLVETPSRLVLLFLSCVLYIRRTNCMAPWIVFLFIQPAPCLNLLLRLRVST